MMKIILLLCCVITLNSCGSDDDGGSGNSNQFTGTLTGDTIILDGCTNLCYQGDGNITDSGLVEVLSGKRTITFGVYFPEDGDTASDAILFTIEEKL